MKQIPIKEGKISEYNKKAIKIIILLIILGIITGLILSFVFINEANQRIEDINERDKPFRPNEDFNIQPLTTSDKILPSIGVVIVSISTYLLLGLIIVYIKIFRFTFIKSVDIFNK